MAPGDSGNGEVMLCLEPTGFGNRLGIQSNEEGRGELKDQAIVLNLDDQKNPNKSVLIKLVKSKGRTVHFVLFSSGKERCK